MLTVIPSVWTPFAAKMAMPRIGWPGVFAVAIVFDLAAATLAFFVLRNMKLPTGVAVPATPGSRPGHMPLAESPGGRPTLHG